MKKQLAMLRTQTPTELKAQLLERLRELFNLRMQLAAGRLQKTDLIRQTRRTIARIKTVLAGSDAAEALVGSSSKEQSGE